MTDFSSNKTTERYRATEKEESGRRVLHCPVLAVENLSVPWPSKSFLQPHKPTIILGDCFQNFSEEQFYRTYKNFFQNLWWQLHCGNPIIRRGFPIQVFTKITAFKISDDFDSSGASMVLKCCIRGTNNCLSNWFYKLVHFQLFYVTCKFVHLQLLDVKFVFSEKIPFASKTEQKNKRSRREWLLIDDLSFGF